MIFTADKERDIIDKLTAENKILKEQIENLQSELETKKENYSRSSIVFKQEIEYQRKEKEKYFREIQNISNLYNSQIRELKEEIKKKDALIKSPDIAKEINEEMKDLVNIVNEKLVSMMDIIGEYDD